MEQDRWLDQPTAVRNGEELPVERLAEFLQRHVAGAVGPLHVQQFPSGFSNLTYLLRMGEQEMVLRRPPFGANIKGGHDMGREYRILSRLLPSYGKVPAPLAYTEDPEILGAPFYVMQRVRGVVLRNRIPSDLDLTAPLMHGICLALIDGLVELHAVDYHAVGLGELGRPEGYIARQVAGWTKRYAQAHTASVPAVEQAATWLHAHLPAHSDATLIHNDYRYDNVILDPKDLTRITSVLDWEMATLGDPLSDVGTTLAYWAEEGDPAVLQQFGSTTRPGNLNRQAWVARYAECSGRDVGDILFYYVYGLFKNAVIIQQIYHRYVNGFTTDPRFASLFELVEAYGTMAQRAIDANRISQLFA
ncbi:MAG: phosphotransferase family protein [Herpetosiphon sp.]